MLSKTHRANSAEITLAREKGSLIPGPLFGLLIYDLRNKQPSRFAFIISTKIDKRATQRNRVKRLLREAIKIYLSQIESGKIILFLAKKSLLDKDLLTIKKEVELMFKKGKCLKV